AGHLNLALHHSGDVVDRGTGRPERHPGNLGQEIRKTLPENSFAPRRPSQVEEKSLGDKEIFHSIVEAAGPAHAGGMPRVDHLDRRGRRQHPASHRRPRGLRERCAILIEYAAKPDHVRVAHAGTKGPLTGDPKYPIDTLRFPRWEDASRSCHIEPRIDFASGRIVEEPREKSGVA